MNKRPYIQARAEKTYEKVKAGVSVRFLIDEELVEKEPVMIMSIFGLYGDGEHRFMNGVPHKLSIFDRKTVLLFLVNDAEDDVTAVGIKNENYARSMADYFEMMWEKGIPSPERSEDIFRAVKKAQSLEAVREVSSMEKIKDINSLKAIKDGNPAQANKIIKSMDRRKKVNSSESTNREVKL